MGRAVIYLDTNIIIRFVEGDDAVRAPLASRLHGAGPFATSRLSRLECRCRPLRLADDQLLAKYEAFFAGHELTIAEVTAAVIEKATELRAQHNIRTPDAIHLATAIVLHADAFLTGDRDLARCSAVPVEII